MDDFKDFDLQANINENNDEDMSTYFITTYTPTTKPCVVTEIITMLSAASSALTTNPGYTESEC